MDQIAILKASLEAQPDGKFEKNPSQSQKGWLVGKLNELAGGTEQRHAFLKAVFGNSSSKTWTWAHYDTLRMWLEDGGKEHVEEIARNALAMQQGKDRMNELLKENRMNVAKLLQKSNEEGWGYQGAGDILNALEVEELSDFAGSTEDAIGMLKQKALGDPPEMDTDTNINTDDYFSECASLPESPVIAWTKFQRSPGGPVWSVTFRAGLPPESMSFAVNEVMKATARFEKWLDKVGGSGVLDGRDMTPGFGVRTETAETSGPPPAAPSTDTSDTDEVITFKVKSIERDITSKGDNCYRVRGDPPYHKFGVMGYESVEESVNELLGGQHDIGQLELKQEWDCSGKNWTAHAWKPAGEKFAKRVNKITE